MTTVIKLKARTPMDEPTAPLRVSESVEDVVIEVNRARSRGETFVALTDAATEKEVGLDVDKVEDIAEE